MNEKKLLEIKAEIDTAKTTVSELRGQHKSLMAQLKKEWKCNSVEEAEAKLLEFNNQITQLEAQLEKGMSDLEEKYENIGI